MRWTWKGRKCFSGVKPSSATTLNAVKPFGAIDTPVQGGTASGNAYLNFGWALTPQPNSIPVDGSTINVWVDGFPLGHPVYNNYRADIATLFPGYANSNGAVGLFSLDTTGYANGVHTIEWSATDTGGNTDGIGSRYFTIQNLGPALENAAAAGMQANEKSQNTVVEETAGFNLKNAAKRRGIGKKAEHSNSAGTPDFPHSINRRVSGILGMPDDIQTPVFVKRGMAADVPAEIVLPDPDGTIRISIPEVTRLAIYLNERDA